MMKSSAVNAKISRPVGSKRIEKPTKTENSLVKHEAVKGKTDNVSVATSSKKGVTVTATKKIPSSQNQAVVKPQINSKTVITKAKQVAPTAPTIKPKISSTAINKVNRQQPIRAIHQVQNRKPVAEKNVMNTIHNVTVASPPPVRKEHTNIQQSMETLPREREQVNTDQSMETLPRERTKTRTLGPEEAIILKQSNNEQKATNLLDNSSAIASKIELKPAIIQEPVAYEITFEKEAVTSPVVDSYSMHPPDISDEADYEDDFDSYESDFETESSSASQTASTSSKSEDETTCSTPSPAARSTVSPTAKKIDEDRDFDSGTYELKGSAEKVQLDSIDEREFHSEGQTDSGFGYNNATPSPIDQINSMSSSIFSKPLIRTAYNKRGMELMKKINLDTMTFTLFELKPLSYDLYMKIYGQKNTNQNSSQTMGNMVDQDAQTEYKAKQSMWTQYPPNFDTNGTSNESHHQEWIGCGEGVESATSSSQSSDECRLESLLKIINRTNVLRDVRSSKPIDYERLNFFLQKSAITISAISDSSAATKDFHRSELTYSDGFIRISTDKLAMLNNTAVYYMYSNPTIESMVYLCYRQRSATRTHDASLVSVWNILDTKKPIHVLSCWSLIICLEVHYNFQDVVIGGLTDGCVAVWNLNESTFWHQNNNEETLPPSHIVSPSIDAKPLSFDFGCVISLKSVQPVNGINGDDFKLTQVCSLHEFGIVTVWTILHNNSHSTNLDTYTERRIDHRSPWSKIQLVQSTIIDLASMNLNRKTRPKSGFDKKKMYFESNLFSDAALRELHDFDARKDLTDQSENYRCVDMEYHEDGIVVATNKSFLILVATSLNRDSLRKLFVDESNLLHATKLKSLDDILLVGLTDGSVKVLRVRSTNVCRKASDKDSKTVAGVSFEQNNFSAKSCAIQNIIKEERKNFEDDGKVTDRLKRVENVKIDDAGVMRGNRLINNQILLPAMSSNRDFVRWMDLSVNLNCLMSVCGERLRVINIENPVEDRVGDSSSEIALATLVLGCNHREYLVVLEEDTVQVHLLRKKIL